MDAGIGSRAIPYYACYIAQIMLLPGSAMTLDEIQEATRIKGENPFIKEYLLSDRDLILQAIDFLENEMVIQSITDEFAPQIVIQHPNFSQNLAALQRAEGTVFGKYALAGDSRTSWLTNALKSIRAKLQEEDDPEDEDNEGLEDASTSEVWKPIPLDQNDLRQNQALEALDSILEELRSDNGYGSTFPEEKVFVKDKLHATAKRLREDSYISLMYINEFAIKPLGILISRFGGASIGVAAEATKQAIIGWLKSKGISALDDFFK